MANPSAYPSDGRITSLQNYSASLAGTELLMLVAPGNATAGVNYNVTVTQMLTGFLPSLPPQSPNVVLAGPAAGPGTATPSFRSVVVGDLPVGTASLPLVANNATAPSYQLLTVTGGGIGTAALPADGLVLANGSNAFSVVAATTAGLVLTSQGSASAPIWTNTGVSSIIVSTGLLGGTITTTGVISLAVPVTVPDGGIGTTGLPLDGVVLGNSTALTVAPATTAGYPLVSNGSTSAPSFQALNLASAGFIGVLPLANGGSNSSTGPIVTIHKQIFTMNGTYTPSTGMLYVLMQGVGGGGGGGGAIGTTGSFVCGAGGGSGGFSQLLTTAGAIGASQAVNIGGGGSGSTGNGVAGGSTSVGVLMIAKGGLGGGGSNATTASFGNGGLGAPTGTGDLIAAGNAGGGGLLSPGANAQVLTGFGAASVFGGSVIALYNTTGNIGANYGAGGSGASSVGTAAFQGGSGANGLLSIIEFCNQ
jgi:hypothetical protein